MRVRQLVGSRANEIVEMPYAVARRAIASGTVEDPDVVHTVAVMGPAVASATQAVMVPERQVASPAVDSPVPVRRRARPQVR